MAKRKVTTCSPPGLASFFNMPDYEMAFDTLTLNSSLIGDEADVNVPGYVGTQGLESDHLMRHKWAHVVFSWLYKPNSFSSSYQHIKISINGRQVGDDLYNKASGAKFRDSYISLTTDPKNGLGYFEINDGEFIRYNVMFEVKGSRYGTALLATPVFDDITIFYSESVEVISYVEHAG